MKQPLSMVCTMLVFACPVVGRNPLFFGADPSGRVWSDGKMWIYPTTDKANWDEQLDWHAWSSEDLVNWTDHGVIFHVKDSGWATGHAWAPDILYKDGTYYFYYYAQQGKPHGDVGVAVSQKPDGPFKEALGHPLIKGHDPGLFLDDDGQAYLYLQTSVTLLADDMISLKGKTLKLELDRSPSKKFEAVYIFKRNDIYYYTIADGFNHLIYYMSNSPTGPSHTRARLWRSMVETITIRLLNTKAGGFYGIMAGCPDITAGSAVSTSGSIRMVRLFRLRSPKKVLVL
jgi:beta-xylosidase